MGSCYPGLGFKCVKMGLLLQKETQKRSLPETTSRKASSKPSHSPVTNNVPSSADRDKTHLKEKVKRSGGKLEPLTIFGTFLINLLFTFEIYYGRRVLEVLCGV